MLQNGKSTELDFTKTETKVDMDKVLEDENGTEK